MKPPTSALNLRRAGTVRALALVMLGCGKPDPSPEHIVDPIEIGVIRVHDRHVDGITVELVGGATIELEDDRYTTLESTGGDPGDLFVVGELPTGPGVGMFARFEEDDPVLADAWIAPAPAWRTETHVLFTSGLCLPKSPRFRVAPAIRQPAETGYAITGTFLIDQRGVVLEMR